MSTPNRLPAEYNIVAYEGDDLHLLFRFWYDDNGTTKLLDTAGWTGAMAIKADVYDASALLSSASGHITITTGIQGTAPDQYNLEIFIGAANTATLPGGMVGIYDVELTDTTGRQKTYLAGSFCVDAEVTA